MKNSDQKKLDNLQKHFEEASLEMAGYPANLFFDYSKLHPFLKFHINNIGDPFCKSSYYRLNTLKIEKQVIQRFGKLFHAPKDDLWGYVTNGGTEGNLYCLYLARELYPDGVVFYSDQAHYCVPKIVKMLGMNSIKIKSDERGEFDYLDLQQSLKGKTPIILATIGTTMKGAVDNVTRIKNILSNLNIKKYYIHCDAAYFGMILPFLPQIKSEPFDFRGGIDSIAVSGHKMIGTPIPCGVVLCKKSNMKNISNYIEYTGAKDSTITGSRNGLSPLFLWHELNCARKSKFEKRVKRCIELAAYTIKKFNERGIAAWRNMNSTIVVFPKPSEKLIRKWQLAVEGDIAHIIAMPHHTHKMLDLVVDQISANLKKRTARTYDGR